MRMHLTAACIIQRHFSNDSFWIQLKNFEKVPECEREVYSCTNRARRLQALSLKHGLQLSSASLEFIFIVCCVSFLYSSGWVSSCAVQ